MEKSNNFMKYPLKQERLQKLAQATLGLRRLHFPEGIGRPQLLKATLGSRRYPEACTCKRPAYVMAARWLLGSTWMCAGWRHRTLPDLASSGTLFVRNYAKKPVMKSSGKGGKGGGVSVALKDPEVCTDPVRLTTHAMGVNIYKDGPDVALKADHEYPDWLFQMNIGPPKKLEELDPETREYWRLLRKQNIWRHNRLSKNKRLC